MRGKRISDEKIKKFIQLKSERNKSTNQIIRDLRDKGYGVRKQRFLNIYREVKRENKNVYYIKPSYKINKQVKKGKKKVTKKRVVRKRVKKTEKGKVKLITIDKEFTSWVKKQNIELDVKRKTGFYVDDYMAYMGSPYTIRSCSDSVEGGCFVITKNKYVKKGIMSHYDFITLIDRAKELSFDAPVSVFIYNKKTNTLEFHSLFHEGKEYNYLNLNRGLFYE